MEKMRLQLPVLGNEAVLRTMHRMEWHREASANPNAARSLQSDHRLQGRAAQDPRQGILLTYALGRRHLITDEPELARAAMKDQFRFQTVILALVENPLFKSR
jgi:hypothetical protein